MENGFVMSRVNQAAITTETQCDPSLTLQITKCTRARAHTHTHTHSSPYIYIYKHTVCVCVCIYRVSQEECARLREGVPYVKIYRYNPKHLCPKLNGYGDNGRRSLKL